jgi:hypothetical protein
MRKISNLTRKIARMSYLFGSISLTLGIILSFVHIPASASVGGIGDNNLMLINQPNACDQMYKCESPDCDPDPYSDWTAPEGTEICLIVIKAGNLGDMEFISDGCSMDNDGDGEGDYCASGIGTDYGEAWRTCEENGQTSCYAISHTEYWYGAVPPEPTPTETSTPTPTSTETSTPTSTPTETSTPTPTSTGTIIIPSDTPTSTPTGTPVADTVTPTATQTELPPGTASPTATSTVVSPSITPTPTILGTAITPTSTQPSSETQTPAPTDPGEQVTPTDTQAAEETTQPTLAPPQITGTPPAVLIPVTGVDLSSPFVQLEQLQHSLINLGLAMLGIGLIFHSIGKRIEIN